MPVGTKGVAVDRTLCRVFRVIAIAFEYFGRMSAASTSISSTALSAQAKETGRPILEDHGGTASPGDRLSPPNFDRASC